MHLNESGIRVLDDPGMSDIRATMLRGEKPSGCMKCFDEEEMGFYTYRMNSNRQFMREEDVSALTDRFLSLRYIEISLDNICNLECRMCDSHFSTKLLRRDNELYKTWQSYKPAPSILHTDYAYLANADLSQVSTVKLLGGEPFMSPNFIRFIDFLASKVSLANITLMVSTNGTVSLYPDVRKKLLAFNRVLIEVSLDAFDPCNDYQRYGSSYLEVWKNALDYRLQLPNAVLTFHSVITLYNANKLDTTFDAFDSIGAHYSVEFVRSQEMAITSAPDDYAKWLLTKNSGNLIALTWVTEVLKNRQFNAEPWYMFLDVSRQLDKFYGISMADYNPELYQFLKINYAYGT